jgi:hypothetical protein
VAHDPNVVAAIQRRIDAWRALGEKVLTYSARSMTELRLEFGLTNCSTRAFKRAIGHLVRIGRLSVSRSPLQGAWDEGSRAIIVTAVV